VVLLANTRIIDILPERRRGLLLVVIIADLLLRAGLVDDGVDVALVSLRGVLRRVEGLLQRRGRNNVLALDHAHMLLRGGFGGLLDVALLLDEVILVE